jgi:membrane protein required for colicin V production
VDIQGFLASVNVTDVFVFLYLFAFFILGFAQGAIRRLVGIASIVFAFFLAAQLQLPLGQFLTKSWQQFPAAYGEMIGFLILFLLAVVVFSILIQTGYHRAEVFPKWPIVEELIGGVLGIFQGFLILMFLTIILDQAFLPASSGIDADELPFLRDLWTAINTSGTGELLHSSVIPRFVGFVSLVLPSTIRVVYGIT